MADLLFYPFTGTDRFWGDEAVFFMVEIVILNPLTVIMIFISTDLLSLANPLPFERSQPPCFRMLWLKFYLLAIITITYLYLLVNNIFNICKKKSDEKG